VKILQFKASSLAFLFVFVGGLAASVVGQTPTPTPTIVYGDTKREMPVAAGNNLMCAGYIQTAPINTDLEIVGANDEREQNIFTEGDYVYIRRASENVNLRVGDKFAVVRPRGRVETRWSSKKNLGFYVQEVGTVEIIRAKTAVYVARVTMSCDNMLLGDLLQPIPNRVSPVFTQRPELDLFANQNAKVKGNIILARDGREALSAEQIVYIDLGAEDNVKVGDYFTIFRTLGKGGVLNSKQDESVSARDEGFQSKAYRGGKFSNQAPRKEGDRAQGSIVTSREARSRRPDYLRRVVGELVILDVKERTATALITRNAQEIHTGDMVELQ
jgi:hypothetical protein